MTDYTKLAEALRILQDKNSLSYYKRQVCKDAADAIEELQQIAAHYEQSAKDWWKEAREYKIKSAEGITAEESKEIIKRFKSIPCGPIEPLPKHGEWVEDTTTYAGPGLSNYKCSLCGKICGTWRRGLKPSELPNWCGNCGADMRKMEVQDGK